MIKQLIIQKLYLLKTRRQDLERAAREVKKDEDELQDKILLLLKKETPIESGPFIARLEAGKRYPKWKDICEEHLGEDKIAEIIANTIPNDILVIEKADD